MEGPHFVQLFGRAHADLFYLARFIAYLVKKDKRAVWNRIAKLTTGGRYNQIGVFKELFCVSVCHGNLFLKGY
ncbi:hypothetical protein AQPE_4606 [Aquipluma nitroreducens]|uniref:Uncharacterized protein n=1 Tax=Aquipluma nitroreducens TaxID=2010828 RepID=A0A5K7SGQ6_9BACT|nr:hypothetical protein AQPE_4606 [Aquipluma nitroreducens]